MENQKKETLSLPLRGIRILSIEQYGAAPFGSMFLADLGAEVIKIENPDVGGEMGRHVVPYSKENDSLFFQSFSANKKSMGLNLQSDKGKKVFERLTINADAVLNNLRGDLPKKLKLDYYSLSKINPKIVCVHLSAYGRNNTRESWPGLDYVMQAEAGYLSMTGEPDSPPTRFGLSVVDYQAGLTAAIALLAGILGARRTGKGQDYDTALFDVAMSNLSYPAMWHLTEGYIPSRMPQSGHPSLVPSELYKTQDGWIFIMANKSNFWPKLVNAIGKSEWAEDNRMNDFKSRLKNRKLVLELLSKVFCKETTEFWLNKLSGVLPCAPVNDIQSALSNKFSEERNIIQNIKHSDWLNLRGVRQPIMVNEKVLPRSHAPKLGSNTKEILLENGFSQDEVKSLSEDEVILIE